MKALSVLSILVATLSGCVTGQIQATRPDGTVRAYTDAELALSARCDVRLCLLKPANFMWEAVAREYRGNFTQVALGLDVLNPRNCDVGLSFNNANGDHSDVLWADDRSPAFHIDAHFHRAARIICAQLARGSLSSRVADIRRAAGLVAAAAAPAAAQGLSSADIERIAKAVRGADETSAPSAAPAESLAPRFTAAERPDDLAVVVGIESYSDITSKASYAERDADAFKAYVRALGVPERNVVLLKGAKAGKASLEKNLEAWLPRMAKPTSRVYFYFSGHGAPDVKTGQAYLVPWDGDPNFLESTAYPVAKLFQKLGALPAKQVLVAMDSCFSGAGGRSVLASGARPLVSKIETGAAPANLTVLSASAATEISGSLDDKAHGAFTYFLLQGLDAGKMTPRELSAYLTPRVQDEARRLNRDQTPQLQGAGDWSLR